MSYFNHNTLDSLENIIFSYTWDKCRKQSFKESIVKTKFQKLTPNAIIFYIVNTNDAKHSLCMLLGT